MVRRACISLILGVLVAAIGYAFAPAPVYREPPKPKAGELFAALQGNWNPPQNSENTKDGIVVRRGNAMIHTTRQQIRIQGTTWVNVYVGGDAEVTIAKYQILFDPTASPATLDLKLAKPNVVAGAPGPVERAGEVDMKGIIKLEGDTLTFCFVNGHDLHAERPTRFSYVNERMQNGTRVMTMTLKKVK